MLYTDWKRIWENPAFPRACTAKRNNGCLFTPYPNSWHSLHSITCVICIPIGNWTFITHCQQISASRSVFVFINQSYFITEAGSKKRRKQSAYRHDHCKRGSVSTSSCPSWAHFFLVWFICLCRWLQCLFTTKEEHRHAVRQDQHPSPWSGKVVCLNKTLRINIIKPQE